MKQHHFVIFGVEHDDGTIEFHFDDTNAYLNDGNVWNPQTEQWELCWDEKTENLEHDERIAAELSKRLNFG